SYIISLILQAEALMIAITRSPRLLIKIPAAPAQASFNFNNKPLAVSFERLFESIRPAAALAGAPEPEWHILRANEAGAEVNSWDLCHDVVRSGFGVAGLSAAQFAEPDLEQQWITGTPAQSAFAVTQSCDNPAAPDA